MKKFQKLCKIFQYKHYYNKLAENMQIVYCILKHEMDILKLNNFRDILHILRESEFLDDTDEGMLLGVNKIEIVMTVLKKIFTLFQDIFVVP